MENRLQATWGWGGVEMGIYCLKSKEFLFIVYGLSSFVILAGPK